MRSPPLPSGPLRAYEADRSALPVRPCTKPRRDRAYDDAAADLQQRIANLVRDRAARRRALSEARAWKFNHSVRVPMKPVTHAGRSRGSFQRPKSCPKSFFLTFYSVWQPLGTEDAQTALVFGFLRHAPVEAGLQPWLAETLGREATTGPLAARDFWPSYASVLAHHVRTVPELVFDATDSGGQLVITVEAKRVPGGHELPQLVREAVDTAVATNAQRLAVIVVGVDVGQPPQLPEWQLAIKVGLERHGLGHVQLELRYSSWAQLGKCIEAAAVSGPPLTIYASDVLAQMTRRGLLGYKGAPMADDLAKLTIPNAFELVNRTITQARQFFLALSGHTRFIALGLGPAGSSYQMLRDGAPTRALNQEEGWFSTTTLLSHFRKPDWHTGAGAFAAFYVATEEDPPYLVAGAYRALSIPSDIQYAFAWSQNGVRDKLQSVTLRDASAPLLTEFGFSEYGKTDWRYAVRTWEPGDPDGDVDWTLNALETTVELWDTEAHG